MQNKRIKINIVISMVAKGLAMAISFAYTSVLLNYLGEELYGAWSIVLNVLSMIAYFDIGIGNGLRNRLTESETNAEKEKSTSFVSTGYVATAIISLIFCSVLIAAWNIFPLASFFNMDGSKFNTNLVITISLLFLMVNFVLSINKTITYAIQKPGLISIASVIGQLLQLLVVVILLKTTEANIILVSIIYGTISIVENIILGIYLRIKYPHLRFKAKSVDKSLFKPLMSLGILFFVMQISSLILNTTDNLLISRIFGIADVTPYNISYKVFYLFVQIHGIIIMPMWSAFTEANTRKDYTWIKKEMRKINLITLVFSLGAFVLIFVFKPLAKIWLQKNLEYGILIPLMASFVIIQMFANNFASVLCGVGEVKIAAALALVQAILNIPLSIVLSKYTSMGVGGVITGSIIVMALSFIVLPINYFVWIRKKMKTIDNKSEIEMEANDEQQ